MKYPVEWVLEYAPVDWADSEVADRLTMSGAEVEHLRDGVMEVKVTPNRGDELSMIGLAREVAALSRQPVKMPDSSVAEDNTPVETLTSVEIQAPDLCPRYVARIIRGVKVGPSPEWMVKRLEASGLRSVNNVVDVTNYVMLELGQPLHAFDYTLLRENRIVVRRARPGEALTTIDGSERALDPEMLVIADAERPVAVAGVMGGFDSEIAHTTTTVLLESAYFQPLSIRRTAKALGMSTDASYRFERGVDPEGVARAADRAARLLADVCGGTVAKGACDVYPAPITAWPLSLRPERCNLLLGTAFRADEMVDALAALGLKPEGTGPIQVTVPPYRPDLRCEDDLAEEVCRILGYDQIPCAHPRGTNLRGGIGAWEQFHRRLQAASLQCGWQEVVTHSLVDGSQSRDAGFEPTAKLSNPLSSEVDVVRCSLIPGLVDVAERNARQGRTSLRLFELGPVFQYMDGAPTRAIRWAGALMGPSGTPSWTGSVIPLDFYQAKGAVESVLSSLQIGSISWEPTSEAPFHPGRCARLLIDGRPAGILGEAHPEKVRAWDLPDRLILFEVDVAAAHKASRKPLFQALPRYPGLSRDISFVVDQSITHARLSDTIAAAAGPLLRALNLFDIYRGERLGEGKQSMAFRLTLRADDRTLSDTEATETMDRVRTALADTLGASFR